MDYKRYEILKLKIWYGLLLTIPLKKQNMFLIILIIGLKSSMPHLWDLRSCVLYKSYHQFPDTNQFKQKEGYKLQWWNINLTFNIKIQLRITLMSLKHLLYIIKVFPVLILDHLKVILLQIILQQLGSNKFSFFEILKFHFFYLFQKNLNCWF